MSDPQHDALGCLNVAIGGPQGVGKSTALRALARQRSDLRVISVGDRLPNGFRRMKERDRKRIRAGATNELCSELAQGDGITVVDLHYLDLAEPEPRIQPPALLALIELRIVLLVTPEVLCDRRREDPIRSDRSLDIADARSDVEAHLAYASDELGRDGVVVLIDAAPTADVVASQLGGHIDRWLAMSEPDSVIGCAGSPPRPP